MGRSNANFIKWVSYAAAFLFLFFFESCLLNRFPVQHATPVLAPLVVTAVALFEGPVGGAGFGLAAGLFCSAVCYRSGLMAVPVFTLIGALSGATRTQRIGRSLFGCAICALGGLAILELARFANVALLHGSAPRAMLRIAVPELVYSMVFLVPVYLIIRTVYRKVRTDSEL